MITSKQVLSILNEDYYMSKNVRGHDVVIYKNPVYDDIKNLKINEIRFIANQKTQDVFIWDANLALHRDVWQTTTGLGESPDSRAFNNPNILAGKAKVSGNNLAISGWDMFDMYLSKNLPFFTNFFAYNWSWLNKYFSNGSSYIDACKQKFLLAVKSSKKES